MLLGAALGSLPSVALAGAPEWIDGPIRELRAPVGEMTRIELWAIDPGGHPVTYSSSALPGESQLEVLPGRTPRAVFSWRPSEAEVGVYEVPIVAASADGVRSTSTLRVSVELERSSYFVPGAGFSVYLPNDNPNLGVMTGVTIEFLIAAWWRYNPNPGPGLGRIVLDLDILKSSIAAVSAVFDVTAGVEMSFERRPARSVLIPFYGLRIGALFGREVASSVPELTPVAGLILFGNTDVSVAVTAGYLLPLRGFEFDGIRGLRAKATANFSFW
jgi:hypothetical protein